MGSGLRWMCNAQPVHASASALAISFGHARRRTSSAALLVAQRFDGIETSRAARRPNAEEKTDANAEGRSQTDGLRRNEDFPACEARQRSRSHRAKQDPQSATQQAQSYGLYEELQQNAEARRAERHANSDLARPFRYADEHDVHDADAADEEADAGDAREQHREGLLRFLLRVEKLAPINDREVVRRARRQLVPPAQHTLDIDHRAFHRRVRRDADADVVHLIAAEDALLGRSERDQRGKVGALIAEAAADALEDADDLEWLAVDR